MTAEVKVIARATEQDKNMLISGIRQAGGASLVTGHSVSDTIALRTAKVGIAMGSACEVAKQNSDLVILNNDFKSIYSAIQWGRTIYENIRKFIQYQLTVIISSLTIFLISSLVLGQPPFTVI